MPLTTEAAGHLNSNAGVARADEVVNAVGTGDAQVRSHVAPHFVLDLCNRSQHVCNHCYCGVGGIIFICRAICEWQLN